MTTVAGERLDERLGALFASEPEAIGERELILAELRETAPVHRFGGMVLVSRYEDVLPVLTDNERYSNDHSRRGTRAEAARARLTTDEQRRAFDEVMEFESNFMNRNDGERHLRLRRAAHRAFTPRRIAELKQAMGGYATQLVDPLEDGAVTDMARVAYDLPLMVICDMLGVPPSDRELIHDWAATIGRNRHGMEAEPLVAAYGAWLEFRAYVSDLIEQHRRTPGAGGPLVTALLDAADGDVLDEDEVKSMFVMLLEGGHETTSNLIGIGLMHLLRSYDQWQTIVADRSLIPGAVEEMVRLVSPAGWTSRRALVDVEIGGVEVAPQETVIGVNAAANRDPDVFPDPDAVNVRRPEVRKQIGFGFGPHFCLGAALARVEAETALQTLADRFPAMELASDDIRFRGPASLRRLVELPVLLRTAP